MRKPLPAIALTPIHSSKKSVATIEYLLQGSPNERLIRKRLSGSNFLAALEKRFPVQIAGQLSKRDIRGIVVEWSNDRIKRKKARRYFTRARFILHGTYKARPSKQKPRKTRYTYSEYIRSKTWAERRNRYYQAHGRFCAICTSASFIELHHMIYTAFDGTEPDHNLIALCSDHHAQFHDQYGSRGNMKELTLDFVQRMVS